MNILHFSYKTLMYLASTDLKASTEVFFYKSTLYDSYKKWAILGLFFVNFRLFKQALQSLQQINVKIVHPVYGAGIRTHNLQT